MSTESHLVIRQVKSENGRPWQQRLVLKGLGLRGCGTQVTLLNQRAIRGMVRKVLHLVEVSGVEVKGVEGKGAEGGEAKAAKRAPRAAKGSKS